MLRTDRYSAIIFELGGRQEVKKQLETLKDYVENERERIKNTTYLNNTQKLDLDRYTRSLKSHINDFNKSLLGLWKKFDEIAFEYGEPENETAEAEEDYDIQHIGD